jgi:radical SAM superfamily enzyme with C-terminal helix-hairpin-helix motif
MVKVAIIDGYVDEPSCLGVPPYISPYIRYAAGVVRETLGTLPGYYTIEDVRKNQKVLEKYDLLLVIAGTLVPGKYLAGRPASKRELLEFFRLPSGKKFLIGPVYWELDGKHRGVFEEVYDQIFSPEFERELYEVLGGRKSLEAGRNMINSFSVAGAEIVRQHPMFPNVICEIETYKGCFWAKCSFCTERFYGFPEFRSIEGIVKEIQALYECGVKHFRLGNQSDFFTLYGDFRGDIPRPDPMAIKELLEKIRFVAPDLKTLHIDNVNPKVIAEHPEESKKLATILIKYHTSGDVAAFGMESADPVVIRKNGLLADPEDVFEAIRLINEVGNRVGENGLPELLPGLNFVFGLKGESESTFKLNYQFLKDILDSGLLVRRINLRQVAVLRNTPMERFGYKNVIRHKRLFREYKEKIRRDVDLPMLRKVIPKGRILKDVMVEIQRGNTAFGRQLGTYPVLVGIPGVYEVGSIMDVIVMDHGPRSVSALPYPFDINTAPYSVLKEIPGIGSRRAARIVRARPFNNASEIASKVGKEVHDLLKEYISI